MGLNYPDLPTKVTPRPRRGGASIQSPSLAGKGATAAELALAESWRQILARQQVDSTGLRIGADLNNLWITGSGAQNVIADAYGLVLPSPLFSALGKCGKLVKLPKTGASNVVNVSKLRGQLLGEEISQGHAFMKHVLERGEFAGLGIRTRKQLQAFIEDIVNNSASAVRYNRKNGTIFYLDESSRTVVIKSTMGESTAFRPDFGVGWENYIKTRVPKYTTPTQ